MTFLLIIASLLNIGFAELVIDDSTVESANPDAGNNDSDVGEYAAADQNPLKQELHEDYTNGHDINQRRLFFKALIKRAAKLGGRIARKVKKNKGKSSKQASQNNDNNDQASTSGGDSDSAGVKALATVTNHLLDIVERVVPVASNNLKSSD